MTTYSHSHINFNVHIATTYQLYVHQYLHTTVFHLCQYTL